MVISTNKNNERKRREKRDEKSSKKIADICDGSSDADRSVLMSAFAADTNDSSGSNADVASTGTEMETFRTRFGSKS